MRCIIIFVEIKYVKELLLNVDYFLFYCNVLFIFFKIKIFNVYNFVILNENLMCVFIDLIFKLFVNKVMFIIRK